MVFSIVIWRKVGFITHVTNKKVSPGRIAAAKQKRRPLRIAVMISVCLLSMVGALLHTSFTLDEWSRTADISLTCEIRET